LIRRVSIGRQISPISEHLGIRWMY
jgi:hypothetical protein